MRFSVALIAALSAVSLSAGAHDIHGVLSQSGLNFVEVNLPSHVPEYMEPEPITQEIFTWPGDNTLIATQRNTALNLTIHNLDLDIPREGRLRVEMEISASGDGELHLENVYAGFGSATCADNFMADHAKVAIEFSTTTGDRGEAIFDMHRVDIDADEIDFNLDDCPIDGVINVVVDFGRNYLANLLYSAVEGMAKDSLGPMLSEALVGLGGIEAEFQNVKVEAQVAEIDIRLDDVRVAAEVNLYSDYSPATCISDDPGEPQEHSGQRPELDMAGADVGIQANFGLIDDVLYHVWRRGLACANEESLGALGLDVHHLLDEVSKMLPGFPAGTEFGFDIQLVSPPVIRGNEGDRVEISIRGFELNLFGRRPDGTQGTLHVEIDATAAAGVAINPATNALYLNPGAVTIDRLHIEDHIEATEIGLDAARLRTVIQEELLPGMLAEIAHKPVTGPIFGMMGYYVILRGAETSESYLSAKADLFRAPESDRNAPDTVIEEKPNGVVSPARAKLIVSGRDDEVPSELLRYRLTVDGEAAEPVFVRELYVGEMGRTAAYQVEVAAVDLNNNVDSTPERLELMVDGIRPGVAVVGSRVVEASGSSADIRWTASDDLTDASQMAARVEVYRLADPKDQLSAQLVETYTSGPGAAIMTVAVRDGDLYRVEVHVEDEAGNTGSTSLLVTTPSMNSGGCSAGGSGTGSSAVLLLVFAALLGRRRRASSMA